MIYSISAGPYLKKAFEGQVNQTDINTVREQLLRDPESTGMDAVVLTNKEVVGMQNKATIDAVINRNRNIAVVYLYIDERDGALLPNEAGIFKAKVSKVNVTSVREHVTKALEKTSISERKTSIATRDNRTVSKRFFGNFGKKDKVTNSIIVEEPDETNIKTKNKHDEFSLSAEEAEELRNQQRRVAADGLETIETGEELEEYDPAKNGDHVVEEYEGIYEQERDKELSDKRKLTISHDNDDDNKVVAVEDKIDMKQFEVIPRTEPKPVEEAKQVKPDKTIDERIKDLMEFNNWDGLTKELQVEQIKRDLVKNNIKYSSAISMLEYLNGQIMEILNNPGMPWEEKLDEIRELGAKRANHKATCNNEAITMLQNSMDSVVTIAKMAIEKRIADIELSMEATRSAKLFFEDRDKIEALKKERLECIVELVELTENAINIIAVADNSVAQLLREMQEDVPTESTRINKALSQYAYLFVPENTATLVNAVAGSLQSHRMTMTVIEKSLKAIILKIFEFCKLDNTIIERQEEFIKILSCERVEYAVNVTNVMKSVLKVFIGPNKSGVTATAVTYAAVNSRVHNTVIMDLRPGKPRLTRYGYDPVPIEEFMTKEINEHFLTVQGNPLKDLTDVDAIVNDLTMKVKYYESIVVILDETQGDVLRRLSDYALIANFVTNNEVDSMDTTKELVTAFDTVPNIARKLVVNSPVIDSIETYRRCGCDPTKMAMAQIPYLKEMQHCSIKQLRPADNSTIASVFERVFLHAKS